MADIIDPATYDAWYQSGKGQWIGDTEFSLITKLLQPASNQSLLDVGCGTGYFSRRFSDLGMQVTGIDLNNEMLCYARSKHKNVKFIQADAYHLPFDNDSFGYCTAITSLCFVQNPQRALNEMWRVSRKGIALGLLNRYSLLYILKHNSKSYKGARWDTPAGIRSWWDNLAPAPGVTIRTAVWCPQNGLFPQLLETVIPGHLKYGGFLAAGLLKDILD